MCAMLMLNDIYASFFLLGGEKSTKFSSGPGYEVATS